MMIAAMTHIRKVDTDGNKIVQICHGKKLILCKFREQKREYLDSEMKVGFEQDT